MEFRRRLYKRGSSFETTIPMPLLMTLNTDSSQDVVFSYDQEKQAWYIQFQPRQEIDENSARKTSKSSKISKLQGEQ